MARAMHIAALSMAVFSITASAAEPTRILYLSKSEGFEHSVVHQKDGAPSHTDTIIGELVKAAGATLDCTKDASAVNAENLKNYDIVIFYTQGDIRNKGGKDDGAPIGPNGEQELLAWVKAGGGFIAYHSGTDTFHSPPKGPVSPYLDMVGGEFRGHGGQFKGTLKVVDPKHPTMANIPDDWYIRDEWYLFKNFNTKTTHVLALLDPGKERGRQATYNIPSYPMIWCCTYGNGRVYVNGMGHREDVWEHETFKKGIVDAIQWVRGDGPAMAGPNFTDAVPRELDPVTGAAKKKADGSGSESK